MFQTPQAERKNGDIVFHPQKPAEYNIPQNSGGHQLAGQLGYRPRHCNFTCGACGSETNGRLLCDVTKDDGIIEQWCVCGCDRLSPTIITEKDGARLSQLPLPKQFPPDKAWPKELADLYEEAAKSYSAGAYTSASMVCRKLLMSCVCHQQSDAGLAVKEGESFGYYVDYLANSVLNFPQAKSAIDAIRKIGNEANHHVTFVTQTDAERSMRITGHLLNTIYVLPHA